MAEDDKYEEDIDKLIDTGKEKGYLTFGEVNDLLPGDITTPDDLDDLMTTINTQGIDVLSGESKFSNDRDKYEPEAGEESDDVELDLSPGTLEKTNDPGNGSGRAGYRPDAGAVASNAGYLPSDTYSSAATIQAGI